jgi:hypothetical protein
VFLGLGTGDTKSILPIIIDPQVQNSYSYGKNNPIALKDPSGNAPSQFAQVFDSFAHEYYGDWKSYLTNPVFLVDPLVFFADGVIAKGIAHDLLIATDGEQPISAQLLAIGSLGLNFVGGEGAVGKGAVKAGDTIAGLKVTKHAAEWFSARSMQPSQVITAINEGTKYLDKQTGNLLHVVGESGKGGYTIVTDKSQKVLVSVENFIRKLTDRFEKVDVKRFDD